MFLLFHNIKAIPSHCGKFTSTFITQNMVLHKSWHAPVLSFVQYLSDVDQDFATTPPLKA
jgi:hypothetical protein